MLAIKLKMNYNLKNEQNNVKRKEKSMKRLTIFATILLSVICIMTSVYAAGTFNITAQTREN